MFLSNIILALKLLSRYYLPISPTDNRPLTSTEAQSPLALVAILLSIQHQTFIDSF